MLTLGQGTVELITPFITSAELQRWLGVTRCAQLCPGLLLSSCRCLLQSLADRFPTINPHFRREEFMTIFSLLSCHV